ncbi:hypothetical protein [Streptomyces sp. NPDC086989]|uniref:hypothetical protein n=1 Tax=Streptomyces sp. NPDC086989 TaxID=3365764 RepID=UPI0037F9714D
MPQDPERLIDAITAAVREGDDQRIGLLLDRFKYVAELSDLIRLRSRLGGAVVAVRQLAGAPGDPTVGGGRPYGAASGRAASGRVGLTEPGFSCS